MINIHLKSNKLIILIDFGLETMGLGFFSIHPDKGLEITILIFVHFMSEFQFKSEFHVKSEFQVMS